MYTYKSELVPFANIGREHGNVRLPNNINNGDRLAIIPLSDDVEDFGGFKTPMTLCDDYNIISGNRRYEALVYLKENKPEVFERLFGKGVPCVIMVGASVQELQTAICDHNNTLQLNNFWELFLCYEKLKAIHATQATIAVNLNTLMDTVISPITGKRKAKIMELTEAMADASETKASQLQAEIDEEISQARHGRVQWLGTIHDAPYIVQRAIFFKYSGEKDAAFPDERTTNRLTESETKKLVAAHNEDKEDSATNGKTVNRTVVGAKFTALWEKTLERKDKVGKPTDAKPRRMSVQAIADTAKDTESKGVAAILACVLDETASRSVIHDADELLRVSEIASVHLSADWEALRSNVAEWEVAQNAASSDDEAVA